MSVVGGWILVPAVLALLCVGIGLLVEAVARTRLPGPLIPGVGLAGLIVLAGLLTIVSATARAAVPACAAAAIAGLVIGRPWADDRLRRALWPAICAVAAFVIASAPAWLSGQASVLGFDKLNDSAIWLGLARQLLLHGRDLAGVPHSSYQLDLVQWLGSGYPVGSFTPFGVAAKLTGQDLINAYQPTISLYVGICALGLYGCARELVRSPRRAAAVGVAGVQGSLFFGYVAWGSIKEICIAALLATLAPQRSLPVAALVGGAVVLVYGVGGVALVGPALALLVLIRRRQVMAAAAAFAVSVVPVIAVVGHDFSQTVQGAPSAQDELGKLTAPLSRLQGAGLWPDGDFRMPVPNHGLAVLLAVGGLVLAAGTLGLALRRRAWGFPVLIATIVIGGGAVIARGSPWIDAKVMAVSSALLLGAGAACVAAARRRWLAGLGAVVLLFGIGASDLLINRDVYAAPRDVLSQERELGQRLTGRGPTLVLSFEGLATRYLFAGAQAEGARDLRYHGVPTRDNGPAIPASTLEMGAVAPVAFKDFNAILRRRTPLGSAAPADFRPFAATPLYESWVRAPGAVAPLADLELEASDPQLPDVLYPAAVPDCGAVERLSETRGAHTLAAVPRINPVVAHAGPEVPITVPQTGTWRAWVQGQTLGQLSVRVDGHAVGAYRHELDADGAWLRFGARRLTAGRHTISLTYRRGAFWRAGRGTATAQPPLTLVALSPETPLRIVRGPASDPDRLCDGRTYDWIEALP